MSESINDHELIRHSQDLYRSWSKRESDLQMGLSASPLVAIRKSIRSGHVYINVTERNEKGEKVNRYLGREDSEVAALYMEEHKQVLTDREFLRFIVKQKKNMKELVNARYLRGI